MLKETKVLFGVVVLRSNEFALSVGCNDFALGVVMIILFYRIKLKSVRVKKGRVERESGRCVPR